MNVASGATPSTPAWLSRSQRAKPLVANRTVSATRPAASSSGRCLRCATISSTSSDSTVSARCRGPGGTADSTSRLNRNGWSASSISLSRAQYDGAQRSISAASG